MGYNTIPSLITITIFIVYSFRCCWLPNLQNPAKFPREFELFKIMTLDDLELLWLWIFE